MPRLARLFENRSVRAVMIICLSVLAAVSVLAGVKNALEFSQDFQWDAAKALAMRLDPYELSENTQKALEHPELAQFYTMFTDRGLKQKMEANQFPSLLMLLWPMTVFSPSFAKIIWCVLNLLFTAGIIVLLRRTFFEKTGKFEFAVMMLIMLAGTPYRNQIGVGQHTLFAFFFFMLAVYIDRKQPAGKAANCILTALCLFVSYFKYTLTAPLVLYFVYKKRYAEIALSVAGHVVLTECAALWLGKSFVYMIKAPLSVASALVAEGGMDLGLLLGPHAGIAVGAVIAIILTLIALRLPDDGEYVLFPMLILWSLILTYHRTYDFFVLSAVSMLFGTSETEDPGNRVNNALACWYLAVVILVYFVLRIFGENTASKIAVGTVYYAFTVAVTVTGVLLIRKRDNG